MTCIIFRLVCNLFDLCCINLCKTANYWDSFLSDCMRMSIMIKSSFHWDIMSESTSGPSRQQKAPPNPFTQDEQNKSLALFLTARGLSVLEILMHSAQKKACSLHLNKQQRHIKPENIPKVTVCSHLNSCFQVSVIV